MSAMTWITLPWPEWVCTDEGDVAWIRHDADYSVVEEMRSCLVTGEDHIMRAVAKVPMVQSDFDWAGAPRLSETDDPNAADAVLYTRFESEWTWAP